MRVTAGGLDKRAPTSANKRASGCGRLKAAFDPTGRIRVEPGTRSDRSKKAEPGNEVDSGRFGGPERYLKWAQP